MIVTNVNGCDPMSRGQGFKRTIMNLTDLPPEEQMKATVNAVKSAALKTPVASTLAVQDSGETRGVETTEQVAPVEPTPPATQTP